MLQPGEMANTEIIQPRKFISRRWEMTPYWTKMQRHSRRRSTDLDDFEGEMTDEDRQKMYDYFAAHDMLVPETRAGWHRMAWQSRRGLKDRRVKRVHWAKFERDLFKRARKSLEGHKNE